MGYPRLRGPHHGTVGARAQAHHTEVDRIPLPAAARAGVATRRPNSELGKENSDQMLAIIRLLTSRMRNDIKAMLGNKVYAEQAGFLNILDCVELGFAQLRQVSFTILTVYWCPVCTTYRRYKGRCNRKTTLSVSYKMLDRLEKSDISRTLSNMANLAMAPHRTKKDDLCSSNDCGARLSFLTIILDQASPTLILGLGLQSHEKGGRYFLDPNTILLSSAHPPATSRQYSISTPFLKHPADQYGTKQNIPEVEALSDSGGRAL